MDTDGDGVPDSSDQCPGTPGGEAVDEHGCSCSQKTCDDGNACTENRCISGVCDFSRAIACTPDTDVCTTDTCDPQRGCVHDPIAGFCNIAGDCYNNTICDGIETCDLSTHACVPGTPEAQCGEDGDGIPD